MINIKVTNLILLCGCLFSAYVMISRSEKTQEPEQIQNKSGTHLAKDFVKSFTIENELLNDLDVQNLLVEKNTEVTEFVAKADNDNMESSVRGAKKLLDGFSGCAKKPENCGVDTSSWYEFFDVGNPPFYEALLCALNLMETTGTEVDSEILRELMEAKSFMVSLTAASIMLDQSSDMEQKIETLRAARVLQSKARALFLSKYSGAQEVDHVFIQELVHAVDENASRITRAAVLKRIDRMNLDSEQFRYISAIACKSYEPDGSGDRERVQNLLYKKSGLKGFRFSRSQLCSFSEDSGEA